MSDHAVLAASAAYRWLACPPSARLEETFPDEQSEYAAEGTHAHALAALLLIKHYTVMRPSLYKKQLAELEAGKYYSPAMLEHVKTYTDFIAESFQSLSNPVILIEQKVDFSSYAPEGFGTCDCILIGNGTLQVVDLKYGAGVPVSADNNAQMMLYALGAAQAFDLVYDIETVQMTICQPRLDSISTFAMPLTDLYVWAESVVKPIAALAIEGKGEFKPGDHCRFCRAKAVCRGRAEFNLEAAKQEFKRPPLLADDEIPGILEIAGLLKEWATDIESYALEQARDHGKEWAGWKLVEGRAVRKYSDTDAVASTLMLAGFDENLLYERTLLGITAMEKMLGKKKFEDLIGTLVDKPTGKPVLVPDTDKRPAISKAAQAALDFKEEN
jgi:hypothetical protein